MVWYQFPDFGKVPIATAVGLRERTDVSDQRGSRKGVTVDLLTILVSLYGEHTPAALGLKGMVEATDSCK